MFQFVKAFYPLISLINEATRPICPICQIKKYWYHHTDNSLRWECAKDKILYIIPGWYFGYYEFLGKKYSDKEFKKVLKMKVYW